MADLTPDQRADLVRAHTACLTAAQKLAGILRAHPTEPETEPEPDPIMNPHRFIAGAGRACRLCKRPETDSIHGYTPPHPKPEPPTTRINERVKLDVTLKGGTRVSDNFKARDWIEERRVGPFKLVVIFDQFDESMRPTPTVILQNPYEGTGVIRWQEGNVQVGSWQVPLGPNGAMPPRYAVIRSAVTSLDWVKFPDAANVAGWIRTQADDERFTNRNHWRGPYQFFRPAQRNDDDLAPFHGGPDDWLSACWTGKSYRWAEAIGAMSRGIWLDPDWDTKGERYWWEAGAVEYAPDGYVWKPDRSGWCPYEVDISAVPLTDMSHGREWYGAVTAMAPYCRAARYMLMEACWPEVRRSYTMDPRVPFTDHPDQRLYSPLRQILKMIPSPSWGNRREAHAIHVVAAAAPYMDGDERELYVGAWSEFLDKQVDSRGRADFSYSGDVEHSGVPAPAAMHFQQALLQGAAQALGTEASTAAAARIARFWGPNPPYYAHMGGRFTTATEAPHKGTAVKEWTYWTHPETVAFQAVLAEAKRRAVDEGGGLHQSPLDCVPKEMREW